MERRKPYVKDALLSGTNKARRRKGCPTNLKLCGCRTPGLLDFQTAHRIKSWPPTAANDANKQNAPGRILKSTLRRPTENLAG